jgi:hypothetical protein
MKQLEQKNRGRLTGLHACPGLAVPGRGQGEPASAWGKFSNLQRNDFRIHSRDVYVSLRLQRRAGVSSGLTTEANPGSRQPTRPAAWWVFAFSGDSPIPNQFEQFVMAE